MFYYSMFCSIVFNLLFGSIQFYAVLLCSILFYCGVFYFIVLCSIIFWSTLLYSALFNSLLLYSIVLYFSWFYYIVLHLILFYVTCDVVVCIRWVSWMWICVGPVSRGCWVWGSRRCISVMQGGCPCMQTPSSSSRSCPSASSWRIRTRPSFGGGPKKQVWPFAVLTFWTLVPNVFPSHIPISSSALIGQFVSDVAWGELDVLLVDTPPGTSDEHLAVLENLRKHRVDGAVLVTTPQVNMTML